MATAKVEREAGQKEAAKAECEAAKKAAKVEREAAAKQAAPTAADLTMAARAAKEAAMAEQVYAELAADQLDEDEIMATNNFRITNAVSVINAKFAIEKDDMTIIPSPGVSNKVTVCCGELGFLMLASYEALVCLKQY